MQPRAQTGGRAKAYLFLGVSMIAAAMAAAVVFQLIRRYDQELEQARAPKETVAVVVAKRTLHMGVPITEGDVVARLLPPEMIPLGEDLTFPSADLVIGRTPRERVLANEIVRTERLARRDAGVGLNAVITPGLRAMAVQTANDEAVGGFVRPGNFVDVIVTIRPDEIGADRQVRSKVLLQGIKVLAVGDTLEGSNAQVEDKKKNKKSRRGKPMVTLELTLEQAEDLALATARGDIHLVLRADIDITKEETHGATATALLGLAAEKEEEAPVVVTSKAPVVESGPKVEVISGSERTSVTFQDGVAKENK